MCGALYVKEYEKERDEQELQGHHNQDPSA